MGRGDKTIVKYIAIQFLLDRRMSLSWEIFILKGLKLISSSEDFLLFGEWKLDG